MSRFKRERGFLVFAQNGTHDYLKMAYGLALSIRSTQTEHAHLSVAITPGMEVPLYMRDVFDEVIDIPWGDSAEKSSWKLENEWKAYHLTPYRETIKLEADMLMTGDISWWWDILARKDVWASSSPMTYRGEPATSSYYRELFRSNDLPDIYTAFMYFRQGDTAQELFDMAEMIYTNWEKFFYEHLDETRPDHVSTDVVFALAMKLIGRPDMTAPNFPQFTHMKSRMQDCQFTDEDWSPNVSRSMSPSGNLKIGRFSQSLPLHYHLKDFIDAPMWRRLEGR